MSTNDSDPSGTPSIPPLDSEGVDLGGLPPTGTVDFSENVAGREFAPIEPFAYARMDHPQRPGEVIKATDFIQGAWRKERAVSHEGEVISPATLAKTADNPEGFDFESRFPESRMSKLKRRILGRAAVHHTDPHRLDIPVPSYSNLFDTPGSGGYTDESNLMRLDGEIKQLTARLQEEAAMRKGSDLTKQEAAQVAADARNKALDEHLVSVQSSEQYAEIRADVDLATKMVAARLATASKNETEAIERAVRIRASQAARTEKDRDQQAKRTDMAAVKAQRDAERKIDAELKAREQELRARELDQRERALQLRDEALARGDIIDLTPLTHSKESDETNSRMQDYLKKKARWDEQTDTIEKYKQDTNLAGLFNDDALKTLDDSIQAAVAPLYNAALQKRIAEINSTLPDDEKWKSINTMTQQEREEAGRKLLTGQERGNIVNPVDDEHTRTYLGQNADNRELTLAISWYRRRLTGRSHEPRSPKNKH